VLLQARAFAQAPASITRGPIPARWSSRETCNTPQRIAVSLRMDVYRPAHAARAIASAHHLPPGRGGRASGTRLSESWAQIAAARGIVRDRSRSQERRRSATDFQRLLESLTMRAAVAPYGLDRGRDRRVCRVGKRLDARCRFSKIRSRRAVKAAVIYYGVGSRGADASRSACCSTCAPVSTGRGLNAEIDALIARGIA
jgi:hypothetical protein